MAIDEHPYQTSGRFTTVEDPPFYVNVSGHVIYGSQSPSLPYRLFPSIETEQTDDGDSEQQNSRSNQQETSSLPSASEILSSSSQQTNRAQTSPPISNDDDPFDTFAHYLPFSLTFKYIDYPASATDIVKPLHYLPIPLTRLPGIPDIPSDELSVSFTQIMDTELLKDTIDEILRNANYSPMTRHSEVWKVYVSYTHSNGKRTRLAVDLNNVFLLTKPWARDVFHGFFPQTGMNCLCDACRVIRKPHGHEFEIEVVFPQGTQRDHDSIVVDEKRGLKRPADTEKAGCGKKAKTTTASSSSQEVRGRGSVVAPLSAVKQRSRVLVRNAYGEEMESTDLYNPLSGRGGDTGRKYRPSNRQSWFKG